MSDDDRDDGRRSGALLPSSSATFALTLDQNVSREVRQQVVRLRGKARRSSVINTLGWGGVAVGSALLAVTQPWALFFMAYGAGFVLPVTTGLWWQRRKVAAAAELLNQDHDVAFVGVDGIVFFSDEGFFIEKRGGWKRWGVSTGAVQRRYTDVAFYAANHTLSISSTEGYAVTIKVPHGWTELDTRRVRDKLDAFRFS